MTEVPKIVYDRLRAARPEPVLPDQSLPEPQHPGADLLTAFTEHALSATERGGVLEHLARCGDCRGVVALALPDADVVAVPTAASTDPVRANRANSQPNWLSSSRLAWASLRWAALAAGIALAASVVLWHPGKLNEAKLSPASPQVAPSPQIASPVGSSPMTLSSTVGPSPPSVLAEAGRGRTDAARTRSELRLPKQLKAGQARPTITPETSTPETSTPEQSPMLLAGNRTGVPRVNKPPAAASAAAPAVEPPESAPQSATEPEVVGVAGAVETGSSSVNGAMAQNDAPAIEKAKPALQDQGIAPQKTGAAAGAVSAPAPSRNRMSVANLASLAPSVTWIITAGVLERSLDGGESWQNTLRADHPLRCYASHVPDVWAGGSAGTLYHSSDNGVTWLQVQPSSKGRVLSSDVTNIDIHEPVGGPAQIILSTNSNEVWTSANGGKTWQRK